MFFACNNQEELKEESFFNLSTEVLQFGWKEEMKEISIETNTEWDIQSPLPDWISIISKSNSSIAIKVNNNVMDEERIYKLILSTEMNVYMVVIRQSEREKLQFEDENCLYFSALEHKYSVNIEQNVPFKLYVLDGGDDWIYYSTSALGDIFHAQNAEFNNKSSLSFIIKENETAKSRNARIVISNKNYNLSDTLHITQEAINISDYRQDGEYLQLQQATKGEGVNLIALGDGFTMEDLCVGGNYETIMQKAADYFFSIEPYKSYRDYFNVYAVVAESEEAGVGEKNSWNKVKNKFGTAFGAGTEIVCNDETVFEYARKVEALSSDKPLTVIVILNSSKYAGTTYMYANGNSIAICPMSEEPSPNDFEGLIHHEAGGHGFGFLSDEYVYHQTTIPESRKREIKEWQKFGFQMNLDFTDDPSAILWKDFIGVEKYEQVGAYEGGYEYQYGVWRSEENSCMNNNVPYFNAQSRWVIVNRIMNLSGREFTVQDFMEADHPVLPDAATRSAAEKAFRPLGNPVWIMTE